MAIYKVSGQMLQNTLVRDNLNLAIANSIASTSTLFIDVNNNRVGINSNVANVALDVVGNIAANNIGLVGNVTANAVNTTNITSTGGLFINTPAANIATFSGSAGVAIPFGNTLQRPNPASTGTIRVNTALNQIEAWDGTSWITGSGSSAGTVLDQQFAGDGINNTFLLTHSNGQATQNTLLIAINGTGQIPGVAYSVDTANNTVTFSDIPLTTDVIDIRYLAAGTPPGAIYNSTGNASIRTYDSGNISFVTNSSVAGAFDTAGLFDISTGIGAKLPVFTVAQAANITSPQTGQLIYVANGDTGNPCLAVYSGGAFRRVSFGANIST